MSNATHAEIIHHLTHARHVVIASHRRPDGDALGSSLALAHYLETKHIPHTIFNVDSAGEAFRFLPKAHLVGPHHAVWGKPELDVVVVLDCGDPAHAGLTTVLQQVRSRVTIINIDHHITNQRYGHCNLVSAEASSTCELVYELLQSVNAVDKTIALCLLTGLITDTGSFSNLATTPSAIQTAAALLAQGASLHQVTQTVFQHRSINTLKLWGRALERLHEDPKTGMIVTVITLNDIKELGVDDEAVSGISNFLNSLKQASEKAILLYSQTQPGVIKGSLRTTSPLIDVTQFAKLHGGGGHTKAAGFTLTGTLTYTPNGYTISPSSI